MHSTKIPKPCKPKVTPTPTTKHKTQTKPRRGITTIRHGRVTQNGGLPIQPTPTPNTPPTSKSYPPPIHRTRHHTPHSPHPHHSNQSNFNTEINNHNPIQIQIHNPSQTPVHNSPPPTPPHIKIYNPYHHQGY